jgi:hypothetical protein
MISNAAAKVVKSSSLVMLLVVMMVVPLFVYSSIPRVSAWNTTTSTSTSTTTFSGRAFDAEITLPPAAPVFFVDTGPLPSSGGTISAGPAAIVFPAPAVGSADGLVAVTMGFDSTANSMAAAGTINLVLPGAENLRIMADLVSAQSVATCTGVSGSSTVTNLTIGGFGPFIITGMVNQVISVPGSLTVVVNEQTTTSNAITVNALHITSSLSGIDLIIASAHSDITCAAPSPHHNHDCVTGSGEERGSSDGKSQFGFDAGHEDDTSTPKGHMSYTDNRAGVKVLSTDVTSYSVNALNQRTFGGHATYNGAPGYAYQAIVQDNAERGMGLDTFSISVFDPSSVLVYANSGTISAGIIEIHN